MRPNVDDCAEMVCLECMAHYHVAPRDAVWLTECPVCDEELTQYRSEEEEEMAA